MTNNVITFHKANQPAVPGSRWFCRSLRGTIVGSREDSVDIEIEGFGRTVIDRGIFLERWAAVAGHTWIVNGPHH